MSTRNRRHAIPALVPVAPQSTTLDTRRATTREAAFDRALYGFVLDTRHSVQLLNERLAKWAEDFKANPARALEWSADTFKAAGRLKVANHVIAIVEFAESKRQEDPVYGASSSEQVLVSILKEIRAATIHMAKYPERSTSVPSNELSICVMAAYAETLEKVERAVEYTVEKSTR
jgi:hypothetical protein